MTLFSARARRHPAAFWLVAALAVSSWAQEAKPITPVCRSAQGWARSPAPAITHRYSVLGLARTLPYTAQAVMTWQTGPAQSYVLSHDVRAFLGLGRRQVSEGTWSTSGLAPRQFNESGSRQQSLTVDASRGTVKLPEAPTDQPLLPGSQDKLSVWAQLGWWIACAPTLFESPARIGLPVWGAGETEAWQILSLGRVKLDTPYGERSAVHVVRPAGQGGDARIELWYVPEWGVLPVRLRVEQANGDRADQWLSERQPPP